MTEIIDKDALWLSVSPSLQRFDRPLVGRLARYATVCHWAYQQSPDEPSRTEAVIEELHAYLQTRDRPVHLLGHSTGGILGLLYARQYPERVRSLALLSVGANPAINWHAHYYALRQLLPCSRTMLLSHLGGIFFNAQNREFAAALTESLERDLDTGFGLHSLSQYRTLPAGGVQMPLLICRGEWDPVIDAEEAEDWQPWLKPGDRFWSCPNSKHFFHYEHPTAVASAIEAFWQDLSLSEQAIEQSISSQSGAPLRSLA